MPVRDSPDGALAFYTVLMIVITSAFVIWWLRSRSERSVGVALPALLVGGAVSGLMESWLDNVVLVGYPPEQNLPVLESFDRSVPIFVPIGYAWFCGGLLYLTARYLLRGNATRPAVWKLYAAVGFVDFVAIGLSSWIGVLEFCGHPPMKVFGYPIWWAGIDGLHVVLGGILVAVLIQHLHGARQWWLVFLPSIVLGAASGIVGWPISTALNSSWGDPGKYVCACASIALSLVVVHFLATNVHRISSGTSPAPTDARKAVSA
jgi:hypothetical protein